MIWLNRNKFFNKYLPMILSVLLLASIFAGYFIYKNSQKTEAAWYNSSWTYRKPITIDHTKVSTASSTSLSSFPVEISLTDSQLKTTSNGGLVASSTGADIIFTDSDGATLLNYEIESYASTTGNLIAWVKIPLLTPSLDYTIYAYFGNSSAAAETSGNKTGTWGGNYAAVYHLSAPTNPTDSTSNANNGTNHGVTSATGQIDGGGSFVEASSQYVNVNDSSSLNLSSSWTVSGWEKFVSPQTDVYSAIVGKGGTFSTDTNYVLGTRFNSTNIRVYLYTRNSGTLDGMETDSSLAHDGNWHLIEGSYDGSNYNLYVDGVFIATHAKGAGPGTTNSPVTIGQDQNGNNPGVAYFNGSLDEVRISNTSRSADWIKTEYNNQLSPPTFSALGPLQTNTTGVTGNVGNWYNTNWQYRMALTISHNMVGSSTPSQGLVNFPVLASTTSANLKFTGSGGNVAKSDGSDILFTDSDGKTKLNHEIESYSSTTGQLIAWVKIPLLSTLQDHVIYIYYGNSNAPNQQNATAVWDSKYNDVYHLPNGTTFSTNDSTGNANNGVNHGASAAAGQIDGAGSFNGSSSYIDIPSSSTAFPPAGSSAGFTIGFWAKKTGAGSADPRGIMFSSGWNYVDTCYSGQVLFSLYNLTLGSTVLTRGGSCPGTNVWAYYVATWDGATARLYLNGTQVGSTATAGTVYYYGQTSIGQLIPDYGGGYNFNGIIDEVRVSTGARSADWIKTEYLNQFQPNVYEILGSQQTQQSATNPSNWYNSAWGYRKAITVDHTKVSTVSGTTLTNFPMLVSVIDTDLKTTGNGGKVASSTGADILFTDSDGQTLLNYEIESYASTTGQLIAWVKVPTLSPITDYTIYEYFGNSSAVAETTSNKQNVWDSDYKTVWHLPNGTSLTANDSTSNANNGTISGATATSGKIDGAGNFVAGSSQYVIGANTLNISLVTVSGWVNVTSYPSGTDYGLVAGFSNGLAGAGGCEKTLTITYGGKAMWYVWDGGGRSATGATTVGLNGWHYIVGTTDGTTGRVYLDGLLDGTVSSGPSNVVTYTVPDTFINGGAVKSSSACGTYLSASIDEVRISDMARSADWIATEFANQNTPQYFYTISGNGVKTRPSSIPLLKARGGVKFH